ncbi:MAG TPA: 3-oxoacyl-ACP reductase family protein [Acetobacteraceae bacterium]|nr:3-oxoacyl-ACP reductase family protein [Acetobacteraceae bacterium]
MGWTDQVALVTGGARGIGRAIVQGLARQGAAVAINYLSQGDAAETLLVEIERAGGRAIAVKADVADDADVEMMVDRVTAELGPPTILVNNAGVSYPATLESYDRERLSHMRQVNADGVIFTTRAVMRGMRERGYGRIVNIASNAGIGTSLPGTTFYAASKAEVIVLTRRFAMELGPHGITVNAVAPGFVETDMARRDRGKPEWEAVAKRIAALAMMGRVGRPEDIANAVAFLASPDSGWITAQVLTVDGGRMDYIAH